MGKLYGYRPLKNILFADDFDKGLNGWINLMPNFRQDEFNYYPAQTGWTSWGPPMLSSATYGYAGTHGSLHGTYSMKISSRPVANPAQDLPAPGGMGMAIKRLTHMQRGYLKCEMYYTFTTEQNVPGVGEDAIRALGFFWDSTDDKSRTFFGARYLNSANGDMQQRWQVVQVDKNNTDPWGYVGESAPGDTPDEKVTLERGIDTQWLGTRQANGSTNGYYDIPNSSQKLCYNETPDKINWHYFALTVDLNKGEYVELASVDKRFDLRGIPATTVGRYPRIDWLLNPVVYIESDTSRRVFMYVDSIVNSIGDTLEEGTL